MQAHDHRTRLFNCSLDVLLRYLLEIVDVEPSDKSMKLQTVVEILGHLLRDGCMQRMLLLVTHEVMAGFPGR